ncbi:MAG: hypoxanthine phosphoribosyltransferase [Actinomycetia bacterium]|nr:hypoxanthine phosphoribosyltransferase [Actinomycetes bacterium]
MENIPEEIYKVLFTEEEIQNRVKELGSAITKEYAGKDLVLVNVLKGGIYFLSDLTRHIDLPLQIDFMAISSYGPTTEASGVVRVVKDLEETIAGKDVIVVEDIIDTGLTLRYLIKNLESRGPSSLEICTFLDKSARRIVDLPLKYKGFDISDVFVVGYGLDYEQKFRNLPYVAILRSEVFL